MLDGGAGADYLVGGSGDDTYIVDNARDRVDERYGAFSPYFHTTDPVDVGGVDTVQASVTYSLDTGGAIFVDNLTLTGDAAINGTGNALGNIITGNAAANKLSGVEGDDILTGGLGKDLLTGGAGRDAFVFGALAPSADRDTITDFTAGEDSIRIDRSVFTAFADAAPGGLAETAFLLGTKALTADQHLIYDAAKGALYYDADGSGSDPAVLLAVLANKAALTFGDVVLI